MLNYEMQLSKIRPLPPKPYITRKESLPQKADVALHEFVPLYFTSFPVQFVVTRCCDNAASVSLGNDFIARSTDTISAIFFKDSAGNEFSLLQNSDAQIGLIYDPHNSLSEAYLGFELDTSSVIEADVKPKLLRVTKTEKDKSVEKDELLVVRTVKHNRLKVYSITKKTKKKLSKSCKGCFTTAPHRVAVPLSDLIEYVPNVFQSKAVLLLGNAAGSPYVPRHWVTEPVTVFRSGEENVLLAQRTTGECVNIPISLNIYVQVVCQEPKTDPPYACGTITAAPTRRESLKSPTCSVTNLKTNVPAVSYNEYVTGSDRNKALSVSSLEEHVLYASNSLDRTKGNYLPNHATSSSFQNVKDVSTVPDLTSEPTETIYGNLEMLNVTPSSPQAPPTKPHNFIGETTDLQEEDEYIPVVAQAYSIVNKLIRTSLGTLSSSSEEHISRSNSLDQTSEDCRAKYDLPSLPKRLKDVSTVPDLTSEPTESIYGNLEMLNVTISSPQATPTRPYNDIRGKTSCATELLQFQKEPTTKSNIGVSNFIGETTDLQEEDEYIPVVAQAYSTVNKLIRTSSGTLSSSSEEPKSRSNSLDQTSEDCRAKYNLPSLPKRLKDISTVPDLTSEPTESIYGNLEMLNVTPSSPQAPPTRPHNAIRASVTEILQSPKELTTKSNIGVSNFIGETTDLQEEDEYIPVVAQAYSTVNKPIRTSSRTLSSSSEEQKSRSNSLDQTSEDCRAKYDLPSLPKRLKEPCASIVPDPMSGLTESIYENLSVPLRRLSITGARNDIRSRASSVTEFLPFQKEYTTKDPQMLASADKNIDELKMLTVEQVLNLLDAMDLSQYKAKFASECVTGSILSNCNEDVLRDDLGVTKKLHLIRLINVINGEDSLASIMSAKPAALQI
eukprot:Em0014g169a